MGLFDDTNVEICKNAVDVIEHKINFDICSKMLELNRRLTSDEIEEIIHKGLGIFKEQL